MNGKPYFSLCIEHAAQIAPGHSEARLCLDRLQIACLFSARTNQRRAPISHDQSDSSVKQRINNARSTRKQWQRTLIIVGVDRHACDRASCNHRQCQLATRMMNPRFSLPKSSHPLRNFMPQLHRWLKQDKVNTQPSYVFIWFAYLARNIIIIFLVKLPVNICPL